MEKLKDTSFIKWLLLVIVVFLFVGIFIFTTIFHVQDNMEKISYILFFIAVIAAVLRNFYVDRFKKLRNKESIVDFWLFYLNEFKREFSFKNNKDYFFIIPFFKKEGDVKTDSARKNVNAWTYLFYLSMVGFILLYVSI